MTLISPPYPVFSDSRIKYQRKWIDVQEVKWHYLDDNVRSLGGGGRSDLSPLLRDKDDTTVLFVSSSVLLALVQDAEIICLCNADELTVVTFGPHHASVVQFVHCRRYAKTRMKQKKENETDVAFFCLAFIADR